MLFTTLVIHSSFKQCFLSLCICLIYKLVKPESNSTDPHETAAQREGAGGGGGLVGKQTQLEGRKGTTKILHILSSLSFTV